MKPNLVPILIFLLLCSSFVWTWNTDRLLRAESQQRELAAIAEETSKRLSEFFEFRLQVLEQLRGHYLSDPNRGPALFRQLSLSLQARFSGFQAVNWVDSDGVVRLAVPLKGNEAVVNRNLKEHHIAAPIVRRALEQQTFQQTGPLQLFQGKMGFACYVPVVKDGVLLGLINGVFSFQNVMDDCFRRNSEFEHSFQLRSGGRVLAYFGKYGGRDFGETGAESEMPVGAWRMSLVVVKNDILDGTHVRGANNYILFLGLSFALAMSILVYFVYRGKEELRRSEEQLQRVAATAQEGVWAVDETGTIVYSNEQMAKLLCSSVDALDHRNYLEFVFPEDRDNAELGFERRARGIAESFDWRFRREDGTEVWAHLRVTPTFDVSGSFTGVLAMTSDLTQKLDLEAQLRQSQKMDALGRLSGGIAHDFNNILTSILGSSELISLEGEVNDLQKTLLSEIRNGCDRAARLISQLLTFSQNKVTKKVHLDVGEVVRGMEPILERLAAPEIELDFDLPPTLPLIHGDVSQVEQVILNLVVNAKDAMPNGGRIRIAVQQDYTRRPNRGQILLEVSDSGPGIPKELKPMIFEPFFTTKEIGQGTGLGLATVHGIVTSMRAEIDLTTEVGKGTSFSIRFPMARSSSAISSV